MSYETDKWIREYFEARPQLEPPAYSSVVGYAIPAPCLHMIESLLAERKRLRGAVDVFKEVFDDPRIGFVKLETTDEKGQ